MAKTNLFNHLDAICSKQAPDYFDSLTDDVKRGYSVFMLNRFLSMISDYIPAVNEFQTYSNAGPREHYLFFSNLLPKGRCNPKYIKKDAIEKYEAWLIQLIARHHNVSEREAIDYLRIFYATPENKVGLRRLCELYGTDPKLLKKVNL